LGERLGTGVVTEVFRAPLLGAEHFERPVTIKRIRPGFHHVEQVMEGFCCEARVLGRLCHPNVVSAFNFERAHDGELFLVLDFVDGVDLDRLIATGPLPHAVAIFIAGEILRGLRYAHRVLTEGGDLDVVHAELSSHNILLSWVGAVKVTCSSRACTSLEFQGTSLELPLDGRSDLFVVGIKLWEMLTGERLHSEPIRRPGLIRPLRSDLEAVAMKLLERDPARCFPDAEAAFDALIACDDASPLGPIDLERLLEDRFPREAPRRLRSPMVPARRPRPPMVPLPGPPMAWMCQGPRRTVTASPPSSMSLGRRWALFSTTACAAVGAFLGVLGALAVARAWSSGREVERVIRGVAVYQRRHEGDGHAPDMPHARSSADSTPTARPEALPLSCRTPPSAFWTCTIPTVASDTLCLQHEDEDGRRTTR
jgi:serine/threonine protein kinase